jgi:carbon-monoxide dehydrogenase small subunit
VRDLARRLIAEFADNLDRRLSGRAPAHGEAAALNGLSLVIGAVRERMLRWRGIFRR